MRELSQRPDAESTGPAAHSPLVQIRASIA